ncbi:hypothetical protein L3Q82_002028 [Scortum barcoo]|uniref:Uncharacterized protein n=1 Tax=Scortum barcoo TaxID=214431 RepID=A0ACB8W1Y8_9TELE|nr:hypothetical protein L3Q82_002028 [Scortum barcoo]
MVGKGVRFGGLRIPSLLFVDDVVLLASSRSDLQLSLEQFAAECEAPGMRISTSKSKAMVLSRKRVNCPLRVGEEFLPQVEEFKYLGVLFTSEGKMEREMDKWIGAASAVLRTLVCSVVVKRELSQKAKLSIYWSIYIPTLTYGHELWVMTERTGLRIQAAEMQVCFLQRVSGLRLRDRVRSLDICERLRSRAAAPPRREEPVEVVWASRKDASRTPPCGVRVSTMVRSKELSEALRKKPPVCPAAVRKSEAKLESLWELLKGGAGNVTLLTHLDVASRKD